MKNVSLPSLGCLVRTVTFAVLATLSSSLLHAGIGDVDANGWTVLTPSADSRLVYVSSSTGNNSNDGLSPDTAKQTIDAANALVRDGFPDWILLKRGDTFPQPNLGRWKNGRSAGEPMVLTYYGDSGDRPIIKLTNTLVWWNGQGRSHVAFVGLDLYRSISDPDSPDFTNASCDLALALNPGNVNSANVLIEDCRFRFCWINLEGSNMSTSYMLYNANVRRNIVTDNWRHGSSLGDSGRIQGMYVSNTSGVVIEENLFHHNGWSEVIADAEAAQFSHNIYMSHTNGGTILVSGNIFSRAASQGLQLRSGGTAEMNAFINNSIGMNAGHDVYPTRFTGDTFVQNNVVTDGKPMVPNDNTAPQTGAIWGIDKSLINNLHVDNNIVANILDSRGGNMRPFNDMTANQFGTANIAWNWVQSNEPASNPGWTDPTRNAASFASTLGFASYDDWIELARNRPLHTMPFVTTAYNYVNYIRAGFDKPAITPPYIYQGGSGGAGASSESFNSLSASTTNQFSSGAYVGDNGVNWNYVNTLRVVSGISGTSAQLRKQNGYIETTIPGGVDDLTFTIQTAPGMAPSSARVAIVVNGLTLGTFSPTQANAPYRITMPALNQTGPTTIRLASIGSEQAWLDDIAWANNTTPPPLPPVASGPGTETFANLNASTTDTFSTGSFTGDNGQTWSYYLATQLSSGITGITARLRGLYGYVETTLPAGVDDLSFTIQTDPGKVASNARCEVIIDGVSQGIFFPSQTDVPYRVDLTNLGKTGPVVVRFFAPKVEVWLDDVSWTPPAAVSPSDLTSITLGGYILNRRTGQVTQTVTVKNISAQTLTGPVYLKLESLSGNTSLTNAAGISGSTPYMIVSTGDLSAGASVAVLLQFAAPSAGGITYTPSIAIAP